MQFGFKFADTLKQITRNGLSHCFAKIIFQFQFLLGEKSAF